MIDQYLPESFPCSEETRLAIAQKIDAFSALSEELPVFIIHELKANTVVYMSEQGIKALGTTLEALRAMGTEYFRIFFNEEDAAHYLGKWDEFKADPESKGAWFTYFQQVTNVGFDRPLWFLSVSRIIAYDEQTDEPMLSLTLALRLNQYLPITPKLDRLVNEHVFLKENMNLFGRLTNREKDILKRMSAGDGIKAIAEATFLSEETVRTHRRNIKRKLKIKNEIELLRFAQAFNLI
jgi:DNA-binding CsgD family transcriptional regulator